MASQVKPETQSSMANYSRREFCREAGLGILGAAIGGSGFAATALDVAAIDRDRILAAAERYRKESPVTITAVTNSRSGGGRHDYFSEADYYWPDPKNPSGPYIQRDGISNPSNFLEHRRLLLRFSVQAPALTAAWRITAQRAYAERAAAHFYAWFINPSTRMNPNLQYAQAIRGSATGARFGVIDTIHLLEVVRAIEVVADSRVLADGELEEIKSWFADYLQWMTTSHFGIEEMESTNNHGTCWVMQVAAFALFTGNQDLAKYARKRFQSVLVPGQMAADGSFPQELMRTKPYGYSLFNLEAMAAICRILSTPQDNLWTFQLPDGRSIQRAVAFMAPFIRNKKSWPFPSDVMYADDWPMRQSALLFAGLALGRKDYIDLWRTLPADSEVEEVIRNFFIRQPILWTNSV